MNLTKKMLVSGALVAVAVCAAGGAALATGGGSARMDPEKPGEILLPANRKVNVVDAEGNIVRRPDGTPLAVDVTPKLPDMVPHLEDTLPASGVATAAPTPPVIETVQPERPQP